MVDSGRAPADGEGTAHRPGRLHVGTSGWHYRHWIGPFYPPGSRPRDFLPFYVRHFRTAEINRSFYRLPSREAFAAWRDATPPGFLFACKASRFMTHMKKLKDPAEPVARLFDAIEPLGDKLGPVLFQLPPRWRADPERLAAFLAALPAGRRYAFEFRDPSWFEPRVHPVLADHGAAVCAYELAGFRSPIEDGTADFVYVRLHGPDGPYAGSYDDALLAGWAGRMLAWADAGKDVYCYFDTDDRGFAPHDALRLLRLIGERGGGDDGQ